jgi:hypothetical protein
LAVFQAPAKPPQLNFSAQDIEAEIFQIQETGIFKFPTALQDANPTVKRHEDHQVSGSLILLPCHVSHLFLFKIRI